MAAPRGFRRPRLEEVERLLAECYGDDQCRDVVDLGGCFSLNLLVPRRSEVVRVNPRFVTERRLVGLRGIRRRLAAAGCLVGQPRPILDADYVRCGGMLVEAETYVPHVKPPPSPENYRWLYRATGRLHASLGEHSIELEPPVETNWGPPDVVDVLLAEVVDACAGDESARADVERMRRLAEALRERWTPESVLPQQVVHGDVRLGNLARTSGGSEVYLDFGFAGVRPRVCDLAYALFWLVLRPDSRGRPDAFDWSFVTELVSAYESEAPTAVSSEERFALNAYAAAVPIYLAALSGRHDDPSGELRGSRHLVDIGEWLLKHSPIR
jgi:Ser/Thr protein kinase RdoA (MazF antagonist)